MSMDTTGLGPGRYATAPQPPAAPQGDAAAAEWRKAVQEAYGWLWHVNNEPLAPVPMWSPEQAAYRARKSLRELLTSAERGEAINAIAAQIESASTQPAAAPPPVAQGDYLEGVNIQRLTDALVWLGHATDTHEIMAARLSEYVNAITSAVLRHKDIFRAAAPAGVVGEPVGYTAPGQIDGAKKHRDGYAGQPNYLLAYANPTGLYTVPIYTAPPARQPEAADVEWRDHVKQRLRQWRQRTMNRSGDRLSLDDFMDAASIDDLIDYVCDEWAAPPVRQALTDEQIKALVLATVYEGDASTPHRDAWAAEIGIPFARAVMRACAESWGVTLVGIGGKGEPA